MGEKMLSFEEFLERYVHGERMADMFVLARQGTVPAENAIRIPPAEEWPDWAVRIGWQFEGRGDFGAPNTVPRPDPARAGKVVKAAFWAFDGKVLIVRINNEVEDGFEVVTAKGRKYLADAAHIKPFSPEKIGLPWDKI